MKIRNYRKAKEWWPVLQTKHTLPLSNHVTSIHLGEIEKDDA